MVHLSSLQSTKRTCSAPDADATTAPRRRVAAKNLISETFFEVFMGTVNVWIVSLKQNDYGVMLDAGDLQEFGCGPK